MSDLAAFLLARVAEDEAAARAAVRVTEGGEISGWYWSNAGDAVFLDGTEVPVACGPWRQPMDQPSARHIVRHDPERVLADCTVQRRILGMHQERQDAVTGTSADGPAHPERSAAWSALGDVLRVMALPHADHPDFRAEWYP